VSLNLKMVFLEHRKTASFETSVEFLRGYFQGVFPECPDELPEELSQNTFQEKFLRTSSGVFLPEGIFRD